MSTSLKSTHFAQKSSEYRSTTEISQETQLYFKIHFALDNRNVLKQLTALSVQFLTLSPDSLHLGVSFREMGPNLYIVQSVPISLSRAHANLTPGCPLFFVGNVPSPPQYQVSFSSGLFQSLRMKGPQYVCPHLLDSSLISGPQLPFPQPPETYPKDFQRDLSLIISRPPCLI